MSRSFFLCPKSRVFLHGDVCRLIICERKFRQKDIARRLRISEGQLTNYLTGLSRIDAATLAGLSQILQVPQSRLTSGRAS